PFAFVDGRLADALLSRNAGFRAILPEELIKETEFRLRESIQRLTERLAFRLSGMRGGIGSRKCLYRFLVDRSNAQGKSPFLPIAGERGRFDSAKDESTQRDAARRVVVLLSLPRGHDCQRAKLFAPVEDRPIRWRAPGADTEESSGETSRRAFRHSEMTFHRDERPGKPGGRDTGRRRRYAQARISRFC